MMGKSIIYLFITDLFQIFSAIIMFISPALRLYDKCGAYGFLIILRKTKRPFWLGTASFHESMQQQKGQMMSSSFSFSFEDLSKARSFSTISVMFLVTPFLSS